MPMRRDERSFQDALRLVTSPGGERYTAMLSAVRSAGYLKCGAPEWDPHGTYRIGVDGGRLVIQKFWESDWIAAPTSGPPAIEAVTQTERDNIRTESRSILFMDLAGWSKLRPPQVVAYLEKALPKLADLVSSRFNAEHVNTWGDALVATFASAKEAAECALDIRDFFRRSSETDGVPPGLTPRVALHLGEVIVAQNPLLNRSDIFGDAVHFAARLEPVTSKGQVCCSADFASALDAIKGMGPRTHPLGTAVLPKNFGTVDVFAVTGPNEPFLRPVSKPEDASAQEPAPDGPQPLSDEETASLLRILLRSLSESTSLTYLQIIKRTHPLVSREAIQRTLPGVAKDFDWQVSLGRETVTFELQVRAVVVSDEPRGW